MKEKIFVLIIVLLFDFEIIQKIKFFIIYFKNQTGIKKIELFSKYCKHQKLKEFKKINFPKISIICPVYNRERFISRFIESIQLQNFHDIEIIFVDDNSSDNSVKVIKKYMKKNKRIIIIKNRKNRGTFQTRNLGALYSKGKYIIFPDPDDIISNNILRLCYNYAEKYQFDLVRFNIYLGNGKMVLDDFVNNHEDRPIYQPELSTYIYYGYKGIKIIDLYITNKLIKKKVFLKALNSLNNFYFNMYMTYMEDGLMNFIIYRVAKSLYFINTIGYRYFKSAASITFKTFIISELKLKFFFYYLKCVFEYSKNTKYEKDMFNHLFTYLHKKNNFQKLISSLVFDNDKYFFYDNIFNIFLNCTFINDDNKLILEKLKSIINNKIH